MPRRLPTDDPYAGVDPAVVRRSLADAAPDALYPEGDGAFEFERTVSRLQEMRSTDWLERVRD